MAYLCYDAVALGFCLVLAQLLVHGFCRLMFEIRELRVSWPWSYNRRLCHVVRIVDSAIGELCGTCAARYDLQSIFCSATDVLPR